MWLDFQHERMKLDVIGGFSVRDDGTPEAIRLKRAVFLLRKEIFGNGELEVWAGEPPTLLGRADPFIPVNVDLPATMAEWDKTIAALGRELERRSGLSAPKHGVPGLNHEDRTGPETSAES